MLDRLLEYLSRPVEIVAGIQHAIDFAAVLGPLLDLVKIALVGIERVESFFVLLGRREAATAVS
jgi:hypothetical protein